MVDRYEALVENPEYLRHRNNMLAYQEGLDPIPDQDGNEGLLCATWYNLGSQGYDEKKAPDNPGAWVPAVAAPNMH